MSEAYVLFLAEAMTDFSLEMRKEEFFLGVVLPDCGGIHHGIYIVQ